MLNNTKKQQIKCRFAPSPTGKLHIGNVNVALISYLFTSNNNGVLYFRIDDTDSNRNTYCHDYMENFYIDVTYALSLIGIKFDQNLIPKYIQQTKRISRYQEVLLQLLKHNFVYKKKEDNKFFYFFNIEFAINQLQKYEYNLFEYCEYNSEDKRLICSWHDGIKGNIKSNIKCQDFVLVREGKPVYHLASCVDDYDLEISHVIRAEDWVQSTPKHLVLISVLKMLNNNNNFMLKFCHLPLLRDTKGKMSKRNDTTSFNYLINTLSIHPRAVANYLLVCTCKNLPDFFNYSFLNKNFNLKLVRTTSPLFDLKRLEWYSNQYTRFFTSIAKIKNEIIKYWFKTMCNLFPRYYKRYKEEVEWEIKTLILSLDTTKLNTILLNTDSKHIYLNIYCIILFLIPIYIRNKNIFLLTTIKNDKTILIIFDICIKMINNCLVKEIKNIKEIILILDIILKCENTPELIAEQINKNNIKKESIHSLRRIIFGTYNGIALKDFIFIGTDNLLNIKKIILHLAKKISI